MDDQVVQPAASASRCTLRVARAAKVIGMPVDARRSAPTSSRACGLPFDARADGMFTVTPPSYRFDLAIEEDLIEEVARVHRLREPADHAAAGADHRACCRRKTRRSPLRRAPPAGRAGLPGDDQLQLRRGALGARPRRQRRPDQAAEPDRQPDERDALVAARLLLQVLKLQPRPQGRARARVRARPRVPARCRGADHRHHACAACDQPMQRRRPGLRRRRRPAVGRARPRRSTSST